MEETYGRSNLYRRSRRLFRNCCNLCRWLRAAERNTPMILNVILLAISAALLVYLVYALLRPEKF